MLNFQHNMFYCFPLDVYHSLSISPHYHPISVDDIVHLHFAIVTNCNKVLVRLVSSHLHMNQ